MYDDENNTGLNDGELYSSGSEEGSGDQSYEPNFTFSETQEEVKDDGTAGGNAQTGEDAVQPENTDYGYGGRYSYGSNMNGYGSRDSYGYNSFDESEDYRWQPDQDKYNSYDPNKMVTVKKSGKRWWIPVVVILAVLVVAIGILSVILLLKLDRVTDTEQEDEIQEVETIESVETADTSSSGIVLTDVSDVVESVMPSVVSITSRTLVESESYGDLWNYFYGFGGSSSSESETEEVESGIGSGTIVGQNDTELLILTSYHVVEDCSSLYVTFNDDSYVDGYIKSYAEDYDLAVVAVPLEDISSETLSVIKIAELCTEEVEVGEGIIVIGDALGYGQSVVTGIISATGRSITVDSMTLTVLQTDAAINSGNSGGCMLNANGEVVGVSEAKIQDTSVEGMCYAIPIYDNYDLIQSLLTAETTTEDTDDEESADDSNHDDEVMTLPSYADDDSDSAENSDDDSESSGAYLGIYGRTIDSTIASNYGLSEGVYIADVISGGGAEAAGLQSGDIIIAAGGQDITTMDELQAILAEYSPGDEIDITVLRLQNSSYEEVTVTVTLTEQLTEE